MTWHVSVAGMLVGAAFALLGMGLYVLIAAPDSQAAVQGGTWMGGTGAVLVGAVWGIVGAAAWRDVGKAHEA